MQNKLLTYGRRSGAACFFFGATGTRSFCGFFGITTLNFFVNERKKSTSLSERF